MTKITYEEACTRTSKWLEENGVDCTKCSWQKFSEYVSEYCKKYGFKIN